jgi:hypothetical protein
MEWRIKFNAAFFYESEKEGRLINRPWNLHGSGNSLDSGVRIGSGSFSSNRVV